MASPYGSLIDAELSSASAASQEISRRALTVVSTSGGLVTLLSALIGFAAVNRKDAFFPATARGPLTAAVVAFIAAAVIALLAQLPLLVRFIDVSALRKVVNDSWGDTESVASQEVASVRVDVLATARCMNTVRSWLLVGAITAEIAAIAASGVMATRVVSALASKPTAAAPSSQPTRTTHERSPSQVRVYVQNASDITGAAATKANILRGLGYVIVGTANVATPQIGFRVACKPSFEKEAATLAKRTAVTATVVPYPTQLPTPVASVFVDCIVTIGN
jgi:hypothetical protein